MIAPGQLTSNRSLPPSVVLEITSNDWKKTTKHATQTKEKVKFCYCWWHMALQSGHLEDTGSLISPKWWDLVNLSEQLHGQQRFPTNTPGNGFPWLPDVFHVTNFKEKSHHNQHHITSWHLGTFKARWRDLIAHVMQQQRCPIKGTVLAATPKSGHRGFVQLDQQLQDTRIPGGYPRAPFFCFLQSWYFKAPISTDWPLGDKKSFSQGGFPCCTSKLRRYWLGTW